MKIRNEYIEHNDCYVANVQRHDSRYIRFQDEGPKGLMLHSVGCSQPNAKVFKNNWDKACVSKAVHAFIDANTGEVWQMLPWTYRGWHCGGGGNNTHIGVEMCEPDSIMYYSGGGAKFAVLDAEKAKEMVIRTYNNAVDLFAYLCKEFNFDPYTCILSHSEGYKKGIASGHVDPEHLWKGVGLSYTMDTFRSDVAKAMGIGVTVSQNATQEATEVFYVVQKGDNLTKVAKLYGTTYKAIAALNGLSSPYIIHPGQKLRVK